jgi:hypothetical protein
MFTGSNFALQNDIKCHFALQNDIKCHLPGCAQGENHDVDIVG